MYNRYIPPDAAYEPIPFEEEASPGPPPQGETPPRPRQGPPHPPHPPRSQPSRGQNDLLGGLTNGVGELLGGLFQNFSLENLDSGDILLILIILFLFMEGDNLDLVIALGLMLLLGLGEEKPPDQPQT